MSAPEHDTGSCLLGGAILGLVGGALLLIATLAHAAAVKVSLKVWDLIFN